MIQTGEDYVPPTPVELVLKAGQLFKDNFKFLALYSLILAVIFVALNAAWAVIEITLVVAAGFSASTDLEEVLSRGSSLAILILGSLPAVAAWCFLLHIFLYGQSRTLFKIWTSEYPEYEDIFNGFMLLREVSRIMLANVLNLLLGGAALTAAYMAAIKAAAWLTGLPYQFTSSPFTLLPEPQHWAPLLIMLAALVFLAFILFRRFGFLAVFFGYFRLYDEGGLVSGEPALKDLIQELLHKYRSYYHLGILICLIPPLVATGIDYLFDLLALNNRMLLISSATIKGIVFWLVSMWVLLYLAGVYAEVLKPRTVTYTAKWIADERYF